MSSVFQDRVDHGRNGISPDTLSNTEEINILYNFFPQISNYQNYFQRIEQLSELS
jgi:hypothetical protein